MQTALFIILRMKFLGICSIVLKKMEERMRNKKGDVTCSESIEKVLQTVSVCRLGMCANGTPYVVPLNFIHEGTTVFLHGSKVGRKIDVLNENSNVFFEATREGALVPTLTDKNICKSDFSYQCLMARGVVEFVEDVDEKVQILDAICRKYYGKAGTMPEAAVRGTCVLKIELKDISVKQSGVWPE